MSNLMPSDIRDAVTDVLRHAACGKDDKPKFLTAYQILNRLPKKLRDRLIKERTLGGQGAGVQYAAPSAVSDAAEMVHGVIIKYMDTGGIWIKVAKKDVTPSFEVCGLYCLPASSKKH